MLFMRFLLNNRLKVKNLTNFTQKKPKQAMNGTLDHSCKLFRHSNVYKPLQWMAITFPLSTSMNSWTSLTKLTIALSEGTL